MINDTDTESNIAEQERRNIEDLGSVETKNPRGNIHCLNIIGQVEGHMVLPTQNKTTKYEHVLPQLIAIEENPEIDGLMVLLNTVGGDVEAGLAIAEMIAGMNKPTVSLVLGGDDQWSNILGGIDLCRRKDQKQVYGMTFTLLTNSEGKKMGKTQSGAVWLDPKKTTPYDFYQYWVNVQDADVIKCLKLLTFVPMDEIRKMEKWEGKELNEAKRILAYEVTKLVHGEEEAEKAKKTAEEVFAKGGVSADMPTSVIPDVVGMGVLDMLVKTGLLPSKGEARRLVQQNGLSINDVKYNDVNGVVTEDMITDEGMIIKKGKKTFHRVVTQ